MTSAQRLHTATPFEAPAFSPLAASRDRHEEASQRAAEQRESGYTDGYQAGINAAAHEVDQAVAMHQQSAARFDQAAAALAAAAADLRSRDAVALSELEREAVTLAVALATELIGRELAATPEPVRDALTRAIGLVPERGTPIIRVNPADAEVARAAATEGNWDPATTVIADHSVEPGGCLVDVGPCRIDAQLGTAIERLRAAAG